MFSLRVIFWTSFLLFLELYCSLLKLWRKRPRLPLGFKCARGKHLSGCGLGLLISNASQIRFYDHDRVALLRKAFSNYGLALLYKANPLWRIAMALLESHSSTSTPKFHSKAIPVTPLPVFGRFWISIVCGLHFFQVFVVLRLRAINCLWGPPLPALAGKNAFCNFLRSS